MVLEADIQCQSGGDILGLLLLDCKWSPSLVRTQREELSGVSSYKDARSIRSGPYPHDLI